MKPISSAITTLQEAQSAKTGQPHGEHGVATTSNSNNSVQAVVAGDMPRATRLLQGLQLAWRDTPPRQTINHGLNDTQLKASISLLSRMEATGEASQVGEVIERMLVHYWPAGKSIPETVKEDWLRLLIEEPLGSIFHCYERQIRSDDTFAPRAGQFLQRVQGHARSVSRLRQELERCAVNQAAKS